jgi:hypothetical protein
MKRACAALFLLLPLALSGCGESADEGANKAMLEIGIAHASAMAGGTSPDDRLNILTTLGPKLDAIVADYPGSAVALRIVGDEKVAGVSRSLLAEEIQSARVAKGIAEAEGARADANSLGVAAGQAYAAALPIADPAERLTALQAVQPMLDQIVRDFPASPVASKILAGESVAGVTMPALLAAVATAQKQVDWQAGLADESANLDTILTDAVQHGNDLDGLDITCVKSVFADTMKLEDTIAVRLIVDKQLGRDTAYPEGYRSFIAERFGIPEDLKALQDQYQPVLYSSFERATSDCHREAGELR